MRCSRWTMLVSLAVGGASMAPVSAAEPAAGPGGSGPQARDARTAPGKVAVERIRAAARQMKAEGKSDGEVLRAVLQMMDRAAGAGPASEARRAPSRPTPPAAAKPSARSPSRERAAGPHGVVRPGKGAVPQPRLVPRRDVAPRGPGASRPVAPGWSPRGPLPGGRAVGPAGLPSAEARAQFRARVGAMVQKLRAQGRSREEIHAAVKKALQKQHDAWMKARTAGKAAPERGKAAQKAHLPKAKAQAQEKAKGKEKAKARAKGTGKDQEKAKEK